MVAIDLPASSTTYSNHLGCPGALLGFCSNHSTMDWLIVYTVNSQGKLVFIGGVSFHCHAQNRETVWQHQYNSGWGEPAISDLLDQCFGSFHYRRSRSGWNLNRKIEPRSGGCVPKVGEGRYILLATKTLLSASVIWLKRMRKLVEESRTQFLRSPSGVSSWQGSVSSMTMNEEVLRFHAVLRRSESIFMAIFFI